MRVGIINPIKYLHLYTAELHLCYASLLSNEVYLEFAKSLEGLIILDCSPELPRRPNLDRLRAGVKLLNPKLVILPSIDYSVEKTLTLARALLRRTKVRYPVGVLQGYDLDTLSKCYRYLKDHCGAIALPSPLETIARREEIARDLGIKEKLLWLEVYKNPYEEVPPEGSMGICTSFPLRVAQVNKRLGEFDERPRNPVVLDFFCEELVEELASANIREYLEVVEHERS